MDDSDQTGAVAAFRKAHKAAGGHSALARICGCTPGNIHQLVNRGSVLPAAYVLCVEAATGVSRHELRPDLYPVEPADPEGGRPGGGVSQPSAPASTGEGAPANHALHPSAMDEKGSCGRSAILHREALA